MRGTEPFRAATSPMIPKADALTVVGVNRRSANRGKTVEPRDMP
jgi:hypothetical protein